MVLGSLIQDASILHLTEALVSKSDQVFAFVRLALGTRVTSQRFQICLRLEQLPSHLNRVTCSQSVGGAPPVLLIQDTAIKPVRRPPKHRNTVSELDKKLQSSQELSKHSTSPYELTNALWTATSLISSTINQMRLISRLPPEVLAQVFSWYQLLRSEGRYDRWYTWVRLMSVSRAWRLTILSFPSLWSTVHIGSEFSPTVIRMLLQRS